MARYDRSKKPDSQVQQVLDVLAEYEGVHPNALIEARRDEYDFIFIRIIDPDFQEVDDLERESEIWPLLNQLPSEVFRDIMMLVPVTPEEAPYSGSSIEFDHPLPPLPIPNFFSENGTTNGHQSQTLHVPLEAQEAEAVKQLAASEGLPLDALIQGWVREKLKLSPSYVTAT